LRLDDRLGCDEQHPEAFERVSRLEKSGAVAGGQRRGVRNGRRREWAISVTCRLSESRERLFGCTDASGVVVCENRKWQLTPVMSDVSSLQAQARGGGAVSNRAGPRPPAINAELEPSHSGSTRHLGLAKDLISSSKVSHQGQALGKTAETCRPETEKVGTAQVRFRFAEESDRRGDPSA
jgi:hypothetical protein